MKWSGPGINCYPSNVNLAIDQHYQFFIYYTMAL